LYRNRASTGQFKTYGSRTHEEKSICEKNRLRKKQARQFHRDIERLEGLDAVVSPNTNCFGMHAFFNTCDLITTAEGAPDAVNAFLRLPSVQQEHVIEPDFGMLDLCAVNSEARSRCFTNDRKQQLCLQW
jgi:hypothetical protein